MQILQAVKRFAFASQPYMRDVLRTPLWKERECATYADMYDAWDLRVRSNMKLLMSNTELDRLAKK